MATESLGPVVDADGHVLEPLDTWQGGWGREERWGTAPHLAPCD